MLGQVDLGLTERHRPVVSAGAFPQGQQAANRIVEGLLGHRARFDRRDQRLAVHRRRSGHLQVEPGGGRTDRRTAGEPVGHDDPVEPPLTAHDRGEQLGVLGAVVAIEPVVGGHQPPRAGLGHDGLERGEDDLAQGPLVDERVDRVALELRVVAREVLGGRRHALGLDAAHEPDGEPGAQVWILGVALEVPAAERGSGAGSPSAPAGRVPPSCGPGGRAPDRAPRPGPGSTSRPTPNRTGCTGSGCWSRRRRRPRAPLGPSVTVRVEMPSRSTAPVCQRSAPATSVAFSASVSWATSTSSGRLIASSWHASMLAVGLRGGADDARPSDQGGNRRRRDGRAGAGVRRRHPRRAHRGDRRHRRTGARHGRRHRPRRVPRLRRPPHPLRRPAAVGPLRHPVEPARRDLDDRRQLRVHPGSDRQRRRRRLPAQDDGQGRRHAPAVARGGHRLELEHLR